MRLRRPYRPLICYYSLIHIIIIAQSKEDEDWSGWMVVVRTDDGGRRLRTWSFEELAA